MHSIDVDNLEEEELDAVEDLEGDSLRKLSALKEGFAALADELPDLPQHVRAAIHDLKDRIGSLYEITAEGAEGAAIAVDEAISDHPWMGFWVGVAAGVAAAQIFKRLRED